MKLVEPIIGVRGQIRPHPNTFFFKILYILKRVGNNDICHMPINILMLLKENNVTSQQKNYKPVIVLVCQSTVFGIVISSHLMEHVKNELSP